MTVHRTVLTRRRLGALGASAVLSGAQAPARALSVAVPMALTGPYAFVGVPIRDGIVLAFDEVNRQGGIAGARIEVLGSDTGSDKGQAVTLAERIAGEPVLLMCGPTSSIEGTAAAPVANRLGLPMFTSAVSADVLGAGPWSFKVTASPADIMAELGRFAVDRLQCKRAVFVFNRDNDGFVAQKNAVRDVMRQGGVAVVSEEGILGSDTDFVALATKIASSDADTLFVASPAEQGANLIIQARQAGLGADTHLLAPPSMASSAFIKAGGAAVDRAYVVADYFEGRRTPENQAFIAAYRAKHDASPDNWAAVGYALGMIAARALTVAGAAATRDGVREAFGRLGEVRTVLGNTPWRLDANRAPHYGAAIVQVRNGMFAEAS